MYAHIVVALDGSVLAEQILPRVIALAEKFGSAIHLMRAIPATPKVAAVVDRCVVSPSVVGSRPGGGNRQYRRYRSGGCC
jgi:nucleotide-binding universal stress UspA family protein